MLATARGTFTDLHEWESRLRAVQIGAQVQKLGYLARHFSFNALTFPLIRTFHFLLNPRKRGPSEAALACLTRRYRALLDRDLMNAEAGIYPRELLSSFPAVDLPMISSALGEIPRVFWRRAKNRYDDLPPIDDRTQYPSYYLRNFHWQSDGWFSERSARLYDLSVELLFLGTADVMRRMALPSLVQRTRGIDHPRILDLGCGTGRFIHQMHRAMPRAQLYGLDLSPDYLKRAQVVVGDVKGVSWVQENAETMSFKDGTFDAVTSIFMFHELPGGARQQVMKEAFRVLRPGGIFVIVDSAQLSESRELEFFLEGFPALYHEPYFKGYLRDDLGDALAEQGFDLAASEPCFVSKLVVGVKPLNARAA